MLSWHSYRQKKNRHSHFLALAPPRFLVEAPLGRIPYVSRQAAWQPHALPLGIVRFPTGRRNFVGIPSQRLELLPCSSSPLGIPYFRLFGTRFVKLSALERERNKM